MEHNINDIDYLFLIPTYERYDMLVDLIEQIKGQSSNITYKIAIIDDCSKDSRYQNLNNFDNVIFKSNKVNLGKGGFHNTINGLFDYASNNPAKYYIFLADDLKLSNNFIKYIDDLFNKGNNIINFFLFFDKIYSNWGYNNWVDGAFAITHDVFIKLNESIVSQKSELVPSSGVWREFTKRINRNLFTVYYPKYSFVDHLGHTESTMHPIDRKLKPVFITNFIDENKEWDIYRPQTPPPPKNLKQKRRQIKANKLLQQQKLTLAKASKNKKKIKVAGQQTKDKFISEVQRLKKKR